MNDDYDEFSFLIGETILAASTVLMEDNGYELGLCLELKLDEDNQLLLSVGNLKKILQILESEPVFHDERKIGWTKIDANNLPLGEVLSANFYPKTFGYLEKNLGYLHKQDNVIVCENDCNVLENISHYMDINTIDIIKK